MLNEYQVDPAFNKNLVFSFEPAPEINTNKLPVLAENWLDDFQEIICQSDSTLPKNILDHHLNETSDYRAKKSLREQLQLIYHRLQGNLDSELDILSTDNRDAIISQLTDEILHCTEGFHNRVNIIVDSFHKPRNLGELLCAVRKEIVQEVASTLTKEIHAWNRVSVIAASDGLGVKANFPEDHYSGDLSETLIRRTLQQTFYKNFTPFNLPSLLITAFIEFIPELEIEKNNEHGITLQMRKKIISLIKRFLPNYINEIPNNKNNWQKYFKAFYDKKDPSIFSFVNLDWEKLYRSFYNALSHQKYFTNPKIKTLFDSACYNLFLKKTPVHETAELISQLLKEERYSDLLEQLVELSTRFPNYYLQLSKKNIFTKNSLALIDHLTRQLRISSEYSSEIMQGFHLILHLDLRRKNFIIGKIADLLVSKNQADFNPLMLAAFNNPDLVKDILDFLRTHESIITAHDAEIPKKIFLMKNKTNLNALMIAAMHHSDAVEMILDFIGSHIQELDDHLLQEFFLEKQANNYNVLMLAASKQAEAMVTILNFLTTHIGRFANDTLRHLFTQQQKDSYTAVTLTARDHPDRVQNILSFITNHIKIDSEILRKLLFTEYSNGTCTALMLAVKNQIDATYSILRFISANIENFDSKILDKMFLTKDQNNFTILMLAARYQPKALEFILAFIDENIAFFPVKNLPAFFIDNNSDNYNCLMLAAEYQPISVLPILNFISNKSESFKPYLEKIVWTKNKKGYNSLMLARHHPEVMASLINFINTQSKEIVYFTLNKIFLEKDDLSLTFLMLLARDKASSLKFSFEYIEKHSPLFLREILPQLLLEKNELEYNSLMLAARNQPDAVEHILNFIQNHPQFFSSTFISNLLLADDKNKTSTLMIAARYQPEAVKVILNFIQKQTHMLSFTFLNKLLLAHDEYGVNALMTAATYQLNVIDLLLDFLAQNIKYFSNDALYEFVFKKIHDKAAAMALFFGGGYNFKKSVLSVITQLNDRTAANVLLKFIDNHIEILGIKIFVDLLTEQDDKENYIFQTACSQYPFIMKKVLNFIANSENSEALMPIRGLSAYFIFEQISRWSIETTADKNLVDKVLLNCSALLLIYFNKDYFAKRPNNLQLVTDKLFDCYLNELEEQKAPKIIYTTKFSFFNWRYSTTQKIEAALSLKKALVTQEMDKASVLMKLKDQYSILSSYPPLCNLFAAYQESYKQAEQAKEVDELTLENDAVHRQFDVPAYHL
ncbi:MAG: hypothetical protein WCC83_04515 [Candidatus Rickettsiella isopodorum]